MHKILFAEDELISRMILAAMLKEWGYPYIEAEDGDRAWELLQQPGAPRLVLLDWNMPGMEGVEICRRLRGIPTPDPHYIILLTARGDKGDIVEGLEAGANDYIAKPYNNQELWARIRVGQRVLELQKDLQEREERYRLLVDNTPDLIYSLDRDSRFTGVNRSLCRVMGLEPGDMIGKKYDQVGLSPEAERQGQGLHREVFARGRVVEGEISTPMPDGAWHTYEVVLLPITGEGGGVVGIRGTSRDITDRRRAENQLAGLYRQLEEEMDKARHIHERTLPRALPRVEGVSLAAHYRPARKLGGDFYDVIPLGGKLVFYLSDVSGHGLDGAMMSVFVKNTINSYLTLSPGEKVNPEDILCYLARQYNRENYPDDYFVCIFLAVLDLESRELSYTGAGFQASPLLHLGKQEGQLELVSEGPPVTSALPLEMMDFREDRLTLTPGSTLLVTTDGLTEHEAAGTAYQGRLKEVFFRESHRDPEGIIQAVNLDFSRFNQGSLQGEDDITFLVLQVSADRR